MNIKKTYLIPLAILFSLSINVNIKAQEYNDKINKDLSFDTNKKVFVLYNLFGSVNIDGISENKVKLVADRHLEAKDKSSLEKAKTELKLKMEKHGDTIIVYLKSPYIDTRPQKSRNNNWDHDDNYSFSFDFVVQIPKDAEIKIHTVNGGDIQVKNIHGKLKANNVNGSISLENITGQTIAHTVNGEITASYASSPAGKSSFKTINGDIKIICDSKLSALVDYKSMHGEFYTNYDIKYLSNKIKKTEKKKHDKTLYHLSHLSQIKIGNGEIELSLETLNGDMTVKHK